MTTQPPDLKKLREVAERAISPGEEWYDAWQMRQILMHEARVNEPALSGDVAFITEITPQAILALLDAYEASAMDAEALRAALEVEQVDLDFTIQAIVGRDPLEEIHLRVRDQKRRITDALNAAIHATQGD